MPKLNTTTDNLELKSNKVTAATPSASWTDAQYPSAKALYNAYNKSDAKLLDIAHPVGSIMITTTNDNPSATVGGSWSMIDKGFKNTYTVLSSANWTKTNADLIYTTEASTATLIDHNVNIRLKVQPTVPLTDSDVVLGTLKLSTLGINRLQSSILYATTQSDGGQCSIVYSVEHDTGKILVHDVLNVDGTHTMPASENFFININQDISGGMMQEDSCDKFYWKRTA